MAGALIGALRVSLSAETTAFEAGMSRSQAVAKRTAANINTSFKGVGSTFGALKSGLLGFIGALSVGTVISAGKAALEYAGHLGELADTLGLTTKDLQTFSYAAGQVGISQEELETGIQKLTISMGKAQVGSQAQIKAFNAIGISLDQLKDKNAGDVFRLIAEKLQNVTDRSQRAAIEVALFGKAGAKLDNLLSGSQGRLNELSDAAEKLGIVLSDEQIRKADETADKIAALQTVLKARIAGTVADNADSILTLANALGTLVGSIGPAISGWRRMVAELQAGIPFLAQGVSGLGLYSQAGDLADKQLADNDRVRAFHERLSASLALPKPKPGGGTNIGKFLAPSGGAKKAKEDHTAEKLAREAYEAQRQELQAQEEILQAKRDLSQDYVEQTSISIDILNNQREQKKAELDYAVKQHALTKGMDGLTQAQADHLMAEYDIADSYKRQKIVADEQEQAQRDSGELDDRFIERKMELLQKQADLATTQNERRKIELDLLNLAYQEKKQALERIVNESKNAKEIEDARRDLANLSANYALDRQRTLQQTQGPFENYLQGIPHTADQVNEALQNLEVQGLDGLAEALSHVGEGWKSMRDIALQTIQSIVSALIKMQVQKMFFSLLSTAAGGAGGFGGGLAGGFNAASAMDFSNSFGAFSGTLPVFAGGGGPVKGTGTATSDSILARLSNGEFVMNAMTVGKFGVPFLDAMNKGKITPDMLAQGAGGSGGGAMGLLSKNPLSGLGILHLLGMDSGKFPLFGIAGKLLGFSRGGPVGLPMPRVSMGARLSVGNDNKPWRMGGHVTVNAPITINSPVTRETAGQLGRELNARIAQSRAKGF